ncbi:DNA-binding response regulator [Streptomyces sp. CB09001]|nr:DNA-binding response regulator [Streptomyces sp. CB09001]
MIAIDDHPAILSGVEAWCAASRRPITVVATSNSVQDAWTAPGSTADVVILDLQLNEGGPVFGSLRRLVDAGRQVVVYSMRDDETTAVSCLDLGAATFLTKNEGRDHLVEATLAAADERPYMPPALAGALGTNARADRPRLSVREENVLIEWFQSESKELVAQRLNISVRTVNSYLDRVRIKYANVGRPARTKASLVARAIQDGLVDVEDL